MNTFAIATNDVRIQNGGMAMPVKALDKISTETPHSSQDVSFAGILNRRKGTESTPAPIVNKKTPKTNDPDMAAEIIDKDETSFPALTDAVFTQTPNPVMLAPVIALDLPEGAFASTSATIETANNILNEETAFPGKAPGPEQMLKTRFTSTSEMTEKADAAIMNQAALQKDVPVTPGKAADSEQTAKHPLRPAPVKMEKADAAIVSQAALQKDVPVTPGKAADSEQTAKHPLRSVSVKTEKADAAIMNPATTVNSERDLASKPFLLDRAESTVELPNRAVAMKEGATATGYDANIDKSRPMILARAANPAERELFPLRVESLSTAPLPEAKAPLSDSPAGSRTQAIINQIIDAKQAMNGDFGRIRIVLSPPNLGTVDLEIVVRNERVEVVMTADNSSVQQALQSRADDIRNALQRHDLKIESFQVLLQDQDASHQKSHGGALFEQRQGNQATHDFKDSNAIPLPSSTPAVSFIQGSRPEKGRVSIFI